MDTHQASTQTTEYDKLDAIDRKILHWTLKNTPASVSDWIEFTVTFYQSLRGVKINSEKLLNEIKNAEPDTLSP